MQKWVARGPNTFWMEFGKILNLDLDFPIWSFFHWKNTISQLPPGGWPTTFQQAAPTIWDFGSGPMQLNETMRESNVCLASVSSVGTPARGKRQMMQKETGDLCGFCHLAWGNHCVSTVGWGMRCLSSGIPKRISVFWLVIRASWQTGRILSESRWTKVLRGRIRWCLADRFHQSVFSLFRFTSCQYLIHFKKHLQYSFLLMSSSVPPATCSQCWSWPNWYGRFGGIGLCLVLQLLWSSDVDTVQRANVNFKTSTSRL